MSDPSVYASEPAVRKVVERFESCSYELHEFTHAKHITVAVCYLSESNLDTATKKMRASLLKFSAHHHKTGYNETITRFWLLLVEGLLAGMRDASLPARANAAVEHFGDKNLLFRHYTRELVLSPQAAAAWVEPDLSPMRTKAQLS